MVLIGPTSLACFYISSCAIRANKRLCSCKWMDASMTCSMAEEVIVHGSSRTEAL